MGLRTFSGLSYHLFKALREKKAIVGTQTTRRLRLSDILDGAFVVSRGERAVRPRLSRRWLWRPSTIEKLSARFANAIDRYPDATAVLQVGTHVVVSRPRLRHYCITDLTVPQAAEAGRFGIGDLAAAELSDAIAAQRRIFDSCTGVFVPTEWARQSVVHDLDQDPGKVIVVGEGASIDPIPPGPEKHASRNILFVGYEWENKGGPLLLEAFERVRRHLPDATLTVIGCRPTIGHPGVNILGPLRKNVPREYSRFKDAYANAACLCLLSELDAYGLVLLEAQLCSTPVVALDRGSRHEVLQHGRTGLLVTDAVPTAVADALLTILCNPDASRRMGEAGRCFVEADYTWAAVATRILDLMRRPTLP
jgi:glycosyltransferase involved in cell wall biosynthesis